MLNRRQYISLIVLALLFIGPNAFCRMTVDEKVDSLFIIASSGEIKYRDMVAPATDSLSAMGQKAVPRLIELYDTKVARERHAINNILVKIGSDAVPNLVSALSTAEKEKVSRLCYTLGNIKDSSAVPALLDQINHEDWSVRSNAVSALGKIGNKSAGDHVMAALNDTIDTVRKSAVVAVGRLKLNDAIPELIHLLGDPFYGPRMTAAEVLIEMGDISTATISDSINSENELIGNLGITILGKIGGDAAAYRVGQELRSESAIRRALAVEAIYNSNSSLGCGFVEIYRESETDSTVIFFMNRTLDKYAPR